MTTTSLTLQKQVKLFPGSEIVAKALMIVGSMSSVGKSTLVAGLCRIFSNRGYKVAPFKAQNMSTFLVSCESGTFISTAQYLQALAARQRPSPMMNPIILKPLGNMRSEVYVLGKPRCVASLISYKSMKQELWEVEKWALDQLLENYEIVILEGAGSPVELNLKDGDIVNMQVAKYTRAPTFIVGDIERGGIFAQLLGTYWLMSKDEKRLVKGLVVNKFKGDVSLFSEGVRILEEQSGLPVLGVVPYFETKLPPEDSLSGNPDQIDDVEDGIFDKIAQVLEGHLDVSKIENILFDS